MSSLHTLSGNISYPYLFEFQRGAKPQNFEFLFSGAVQILTSRNSLGPISEQENHRSHTMTQCDDYNKDLCICNKLWRFSLISPVSQKVKQGRGERFPPKAWRLFLPTTTSLGSIKSFVFTHQNKHFLLAKTDKIYFGFLKVTDCKYWKSIHKIIAKSCYIFYFPEGYISWTFLIKIKKVKLCLDSHTSPKIIYCKLLNSFYARGHASPSA